MRPYGPPIGIPRGWPSAPSPKGPPRFGGGLPGFTGAPHPAIRPGLLLGDYARGGYSQPSSKPSPPPIGPGSFGGLRPSISPSFQGGVLPGGWPGGASGIDPEMIQAILAALQGGGRVQGGFGGPSPRAIPRRPQGFQTGGLTQYLLGG